MAIKDIFKSNIHVQQAGNLPYSNMLGVPLPLSSRDDHRDAIPGAAFIDYDITVGENCIIDSTEAGINASSIPNTTINVQMRNLFNKVRSANSGSVNYAPVDMSMYLLYTANLLSFLVQSARLFALSNTVSFYNKFKPNRLMEVGFTIDPDEFYREKPQYIAKFNYLVDRFNSLAKPSEFKLYSAIALWFKGAFSDEDTDKAQLYFLTNNIIRYWSGTKYSTGTSLVCSDFLFSNYEEWSNLADRIFAPVGTDQDLNIISGDIIKSGVGLFHFGYYDDTNHPTLPIEHDQSALELIHNTVIYPSARALNLTISTDGTTFDYGDIVQDSSESFVSPVIIPVVADAADTYTMIGNSGWILDVTNQKVPPIDVTVNASLAISLPDAEVLAYKPSGEVALIAISNPGILIGRSIIVALPSYYEDIPELVSSVLSYYDPGTASGLSTAVILTQFNMYPKLAFDPYGTSLRNFGEIDNFELVTRAECSRLHNAVVAFLYDINSNTSK